MDDERTTTAGAGDDELALGLRAAIGRLSRRLRDTAAGHGLTPTQTSVLFMVARRGPLGMSELAALEDLNPTMLSRVVGLLVERGLLARTADPADRRAALVAATAAGVELRERIHRERAGTLGRELARLDDAERAALAAAVPLLERLATQLGEGRAAAAAREPAAAGVSSQTVERGR